VSTSNVVVGIYNSIIFTKGTGPFPYHAERHVRVLHLRTACVSEPKLGEIPVATTRQAPTHLLYLKQSAKGAGFRLNVQSSGQESLCHLLQQGRLQRPSVEPFVSLPEAGG
jgi:hypothetical protein